MSDVRLIDSRELHKRLSDLSERWYRAKKFGVAQGLAMAIEEVCNTDTIDPIRAAGGCWCGECRYRNTCDHTVRIAPGGPGKGCLHGNLHGCEYGEIGEPREAQDDG